MKWKCLRCEAIFGEAKVREPGCPCRCKELGFPSPSPWQPVFESDLRTFQREVHQWAGRTFKTQSVPSKLDHLEDEVRELKENPTDPMEMADILLLLLGIAEMQGVDLWEAAQQKHAINQTRTWGAPDERGVSKHVE